MEEDGPREESTSRSIAVTAVDALEFETGDVQAAPIDLVELCAWPPRQGQRAEMFPFWIDLRFAEQTITTSHWRIEIKLTRAELALELEGCSVERGTRYGDDPLRAVETTKQLEKGETNFTGSGEASGKVGIGVLEGLTASASAQGAVKAQTSSVKATERSAELQHRRVAALPNNRWEITETNGPLHGTYFRAPEKEDVERHPLCKVSAKKAEFSITTFVKIRPQDLQLHIDYIGSLPLKGGWRKLNPPEKPNKEAVAKLLLRAASTKRFRRTGDERIILACSVLKGRRDGVGADDDPN